MSYHGLSTKCPPDFNYLIYNKSAAGIFLLIIAPHYNICVRRFSIFGKKMSMRYLLPFFLLLFIFCNQLSAKQVSQADARKVAQSVIRDKAPDTWQDAGISDNVLSVTENGAPVYYVFDVSEKGFVIVAADDVVMPVLGYSFAGGYSTENQPVNFISWMNGYADQIRYARQNNLQPDDRIRQLWDDYLSGKHTSVRSTMTSVAPLLTCNWNQDSPYNLLCPADPTGPGGHVYAGCVATAMAQIAYYWRWPLQGTGSHGYYCDNYGYLFADFGNTQYHWDQMINGAIGFNFEMAQLQSHFGIAVDMMYSPSGSGAYSEDAANALRTYFGYSNQLTLVYKDNYTDAQWSSLMRQQLDAGQPMYYHGFGSGGHAFNLDGYSDDLYFHFNWGWGGSFNGYFLLSNLNPGGSNFSEGQGAIINFVPNNSYPYYCVPNNALTGNYGTLEDGSGPVQPYLQNSACNWLIAPTDSIANLKLTFHRFNLEDNHDFLTIYDGPDSDAPVLATLTGQSLPSPVTATGSKMYIEFTTDNAGSDNGWFASYSTQAVNFCPGVTTLTQPSGTFTDGSGTFNYHNNSVCKYRILPDNAHSITLTFNEFNTFNENDFLLIIDINTGNTLYKLSGSVNPGPLFLNTGKVLILFKTDQLNTASGWSITYTADTYTGIENLPESALLFYPNPVKGILNITLDGKIGEMCELKLFNAAGQSVLTKQLSLSDHSNSTQIDVSGYPAGIYTLRCIGKKGVATGKVIIE